MKILYAIQGTGNGHVTRAREIVPLLRKNHDIDILISDFEPVSSWACYFAGKPCVSVSHQAAVINKKSPKAGNFDPIGKTILRSYAPSASQYGFHFKPYDTNIFSPVIRSEIRLKKSSDSGHYTVYLPAYDDGRIVKILSMVEDIEWQVFSKHNKQSFRKETDGNTDEGTIRTAM